MKPIGLLSRSALLVAGLLALVSSASRQTSSASSSSSEKCLTTWSMTLSPSATSQDRGTKRVNTWAARGTPIQSTTARTAIAATVITVARRATAVRLRRSMVK